MQHAIVLPMEKKKKKKTITRVNNWLLAHLKFPRIITTDQLDDSAARCLPLNVHGGRRIISTQRFEEIFDARRIENFSKFWSNSGLRINARTLPPRLRNNPKKRSRNQLEKKYKTLERTSCLRGQVQGSSVKNRVAPPPRVANTGLGPLDQLSVSQSIRPVW